MKRFYSISSVLVKAIYGGFAVVVGIGANSPIIMLPLLLGAGFILVSFIPNWKQSMLTTMLGIVMIASGSMALAIDAGVYLLGYLALFVITHILIVSLMFKTDELSKT